MQPYKQISFTVSQFASYGQLGSSDISALQSEFNKIRDWVPLLANIEKNGLAPTTLNCINQYQLSIPETQLVQLNALKLRHVAISNARKKLVEQLTKHFFQAKVPFIALKGLALANLIYPEASSRPMRDIDILVSTSDLKKASLILREMGFNLPDQYKSQFMNGVHQLPDANLMVDGFNISVEIHHNTMHRDVFDSLTFEDAKDKTQGFNWGSVEMLALDHTLMLHHLCRHLQSQHPDDLIKQINIVDIIRYCHLFSNQINWQELQTDYPHIINTLRCLHFIIPLKPEVSKHISDLENSPPKNVGQCMLALSRILVKDKNLKRVLTELFSPSDWWLHLHYSIPPNNSLLLTKLIRHPIRVFKMLLLRLKSKHT